MIAGVAELFVIVAFLFLIWRLLRRQKKTASAPRSDVQVVLQSERKRIPAGTEIVRVPPGVKIRVRRSRTIEHAVIVNWRTSKTRELGIQQVLSASIRNEIERSTGRSYQQRETVEYEVELDGGTADQYRLTWTDVLMTGTSRSELRSAQDVPFEFLERSELDVAPFSEAAAR